MIVNLRRGSLPSLPVPATADRPLLGKPLLLVAVDETVGTSRYIRGYRAVSEIFEDDGKRHILVAPEADWSAWTLGGRGSGECPNARRWPADLVWVEPDASPVTVKR